MDAFSNDVLRGLQASPKHLHSKYFYDAQGDLLFQQIMASPDYYLTRCEAEIFRQQTRELAVAIRAFDTPFDLIELGAGDATKSEHLLELLAANGADFTYMPIDISGNILQELEARLSTTIPGLSLHPLQGDYFDMLKRASALSSRRKVILFLGGNLGNMPEAEALLFCCKLRTHLQPGDVMLTGFDLKKHPRIILNAYDDAEGITARFNLNLLERINRELGGDFRLAQFEHYQTYDPDNGNCKSYLVSLCRQTVQIQGESFEFAKDECIYMEISKKYSIPETEAMARYSGFEPAGYRSDSKGWFVDAIWNVN